MSEFERQLEQNLQNDIKTFISDPKYRQVKDMYKSNFDNIQQYIAISGYNLAIEDISNLDPSLSPFITSERLLLKEINKAIQKGRLTLAML